MVSRFLSPCDFIRLVIEGQPVSTGCDASGGRMICLGPDSFFQERRPIEGLHRVQCIYDIFKGVWKKLRTRTAVGSEKAPAEIIEGFFSAGELAYVDIGLQ